MNKTKTTKEKCVLHKEMDSHSISGNNNSIVNIVSLDLKIYEDIKLLIDQVRELRESLDIVLSEIYVNNSSTEKG